jgi:GT2 family glycosyltransferase
MNGPRPAEPPRVSAVIVSYNTRDELLRSLASLRSVTLPIEVLVVDNASTDGSAEAVSESFPEARLRRNAENLGFSRANNQALREARALYVLLLNSDAEVRPGCVESLVDVLDRRADAAVAGPRTLSADGTAQVSFGPALTPLAEWRQRRLVRGVRARRPDALRHADDASRREAEPDWVSASCFLARRRALEAVGLFDEGYFLYEEDADLCRRLRNAGWRVVFTPAAEVVHRLGRSMARAPARARLEYHRSHLRYYRKHNGALRTAALRAAIAGGAVVRWLAALGPGAERRRRRQEELRVLQLALSLPRS